MVKIFYGEDRVAVEKAIKQVFGGDFEVISGEGMKLADLRDACLGRSFLAENRKVVLKDVSGNGEVWGEVSNVFDEMMREGNEVIFWEEKLDKRTKTYKELAKNGVEMKEFALIDREAMQNAKLVFDILEIAMRDGKKAIAMVEKIELNQDPYMLVGLFTTQILKKYGLRGGAKEKKVLLALSKLDMEMKSNPMQPWILLKAFLLELSQ